MPHIMQIDSASGGPCTSEITESLRQAQRLWQAQNIAARLRIMHRCRHLIACHAQPLAQAIELPQRRNVAESIAAEVFPLADAIEYLERNAQRLLAPRIESNRDKPLWGRGLRVVTHRDPLGLILIIGTWNYPLFLTGVQLVQALVAGNAVIVKPGTGCHAVTKQLIELLVEAGIPSDLISLRTEDAAAAQQAIEQGVDKTVFTGSAATGRLVMSQLAKQGTPSVMELSGSDAVFVLDGADLDRVARCLAFGIPMNGGATCIAPRRVFASRTAIDGIQQRLLPVLRAQPPVPVYAPAGRHAADLVTDRTQPGAKRILPTEWPAWKSGDRFPVTVMEVENPRHPILLNDIFAPVISFISVESPEVALRQASDCPYALGASVFGKQQEAQAFAQKVDAGSVVVNDLVAPTADPRVAFGGRRSSGFGSTRGPAGLLEMTQVKAIVTQTSNWLPHLNPPIPELGPLLLDLLRFRHGNGWRDKWQALRGLAQSGRVYWSELRRNSRQSTTIEDGDGTSSHAKEEGANHV